MKEVIVEMCKLCISFVLSFIMISSNFINSIISNKSDLFLLGENSGFSYWNVYNSSLFKVGHVWGYVSRHTLKIYL